MRPIKVGLSGGISVVGTLADIAGSVIFALVIGFIFSLGNMDKMIIVLTGSLGMILDNILGSLWQSKYKETDDITEEKTFTNQLIHGCSWLNNDGVNLLVNVLVVGFTIWIIISF